MKIKNNFLRLATVLTVLFFLYTALTLIDQTYQATVLTHSNMLSSSKAILPDKHDYQHLKELGFSDVVISHMSRLEFDRFRGIEGKVVDEKDIYREVTSEDEERISKTAYSKLLQRYSESKLPHTASLDSVHLRLVSEGNQKFLMITEHHFDYSPHDLNPLGIELQLRPDFIVLDQLAKQIWWTSSSWKPEQIKSGVKNIEISSFRPENNGFGFFNEESSGSTFYSVLWKQPSLFEDVIGLNFYTVTEFEAPKDYTIIDAYIQGQNPHLSEQVLFDISVKD